MKTIETYLPVFPGFYGTIFEPNEDSELEYITDHRSGITKNLKLTPVPYDYFEFDYKGYQNEIGERCCEFIKSELDNFISKIEFQNINSPREYNFSNDSINIKVSLTQNNIKAIKKFIKDHKPEFQSYIFEKYSSRSGFISHYSNDSKEWLNDIYNCLEHIHQLGSILQFICWCSDINQESMYEYCSDVSLNVSNHDELYYMEFCPVCKQFVNPTSFKGNCCEDCHNSKIENFELFICSKCKDEITSAHEKRHLEHQIKHGNMMYSDILCDKCQ